MKITINGREIALSRKDKTQELGEILNSQGLIAYEIKINDSQTLYQLESIKWEELAEDSNIEIIAVSGVEYCLLTLKDAVPYISRLLIGLKKIHDLYREEKIEEASSLLREAIDGIEWINNIILQIEPVLGLDYQTMKLKGGESVASYYQKYSDSLTRLTEVLQENDYFMAADILEYEIIPAFEAWQELFEGILKAGEKQH